MLRTSGNVEIGHVATVHTFFDGKVQHRLLLAIIDTGDTCLVALLFIELQVLNDAEGNVLQCRLHVAQHKLLAVKQNLLYRPTIDGDIAILVDLGTWNALDEFLNGRPLGGAVGVRIIY